MIKLDKVSKKFGTGVFALSEINLNVDKQEFVFLVGPTGSGKTTIFRLITRELLPTEGVIIVNDWNIGKLPKQKIPHLRKKVGVVFQDLKLLLDRTIFENIALPLEIVGKKEEEIKRKVEEVLTQVGLIEHKDKFPIQLSGGEMQRAAIARALVLSPEILLADEPTGNLDIETSWEIVKILSDINAKGTTIIMATHNTDIVSKLSKRVVKLEKGRIVKDEKKKSEEKKEQESAERPKETK
ncbi:MAG: cell division ATP-binding protein FtsE [Candidatus Levybacteria bacterium]|nr:cell division ATP-binding protein FtsE [Candidatus Levybacteria bacterium]